ncbi:MAG TPA: hypothetical protein DCM59_02660 [Clostridium sp.]|nr:hypothetical protein [Clostridium sp.]
MSNCKFDFGTFQDECNCATNIVGRKNLFEDKEDFLYSCEADFDYVINEGEYTVDDVKEGQIRYLPRGCEGRKNGYYLVSGRMKGSTDVYYIDL